jgi:hypothetical protein
MFLASGVNRLDRFPYARVVRLAEHTQLGRKIGRTYEEKIDLWKRRDSVEVVERARGFDLYADQGFVAAGIGHFAGRAAREIPIGPLRVYPAPTGW